LVIEFCSGPKHLIFFSFLRNFGILSQLLILNVHKWERIGLSKLMNKSKIGLSILYMGGMYVVKISENILTQRLRYADYIDDRKF